MEYSFKYSSKIGDIIITADDANLLSIKFSNDAHQNYNGINLIIEKTIKQLDEYFTLRRKDFDLPLELIGSDMQKKVYSELIKIPYGETRTYKQIAALTGNEKACRAVGKACNKNPIAIVIPCHRVIGSDMQLKGYAGGLDKKKFLLELELENN